MSLISNSGSEAVVVIIEELRERDAITAEDGETIISLMQVLSGEIPESERKTIMQMIQRRRADGNDFKR